MNNGKAAKNFQFKKGTFYKFNRSIYMIIGFADVFNEQVGIVMRVVMKNGRFNIKHHTKVNKNVFIDYFQVIDYNDVYIDKRDKDIFDDFIKYVEENTFDMTYKNVSYTTHYGFNYYWCSNLNIRHANSKNSNNIQIEFEIFLNQEIVEIT